MSAFNKSFAKMQAASKAQAEKSIPGLDLSDTNRSPGLLPVKPQLPLPDAPAATDASTTIPFYKMPIVWVGLAGVAFVLLSGGKKKD